MPSVRYYNQTAPFWDFVAGLEEQGSTHPFFARNDRGEESDSDNNQGPNPWAQGWAGFPFGPMPHRGRHGPHGRHHGPPPPGHDHMNAPDPDMSVPPEHNDDAQEGPSEPRGPPPPFSEKPDHGHGRHGGPGRHHGPHGHGGPGAHKGRCGGRGMGGWGGRGRGGPFAHPAAGGFGALASMFQDQLFGETTKSEKTTEDKKSDDFSPEVDVFDTADSFVVHVSLPGAKKEDVGVNWDVEKSELNIAGVIYRPGDEELLKSLALDERKVGAFERKVRLGSRANPAQVDVDGISAKLEDGILRVDVPKLDSGYVEIKKVDIE